MTSIGTVISNITHELSKLHKPCSEERLHEMTNLSRPKSIDSFDDLFQATVAITNDVMDKIEADLRELGPDEWLKRWEEEVNVLDIPVQGSAKI